MKVTDSNGKVLYEQKPQPDRQVADASKVYLINNILSDKTAKYQAYGTFWANRLNFQENIGVKTGTSELKTDNWTFGYTPSYTVGIWVGNNDNSPMHPALASGVTGAAPIYREIMENVLKGKPIDKFVRPDNVVTMEVDSITGQKADQYSSSKRSEVFDKSNLPPEDDMHVKVRICTPSGLLANASCEASGQASDQVYTVLYDAYTKQLQNNSTQCSPCPPTQTDPNTYSASGPTSSAPVVTITSPSAGAKINKGNAVFSATVTSGGSVQKVTFILKNNAGGVDQTKNSSNNSSPYTATFTLLPLASYTLRVQAFDDKGNVGESPPVAFTTSN